MESLFLIDDVGYRVHVLNLTRKFSVLDTENTGRTMDGRMYREPIGTFYNYSMTVAPMGDGEELEKFWEAVSRPAVSHYCQFPYGQKTIAQHMYITSGEQELIRTGEGGNFWGEITVNFIAMTPKVVA